MKKKWILIGLLAIALGAVATWWLTSEEPEPEVIPEVTVLPPFLEHDTLWADSVMKTMTLEEKIGQLFIVESDAGFEEHEDSLAKWIGQFGIGGVHFKPSHLVDRALLQNYCNDTTRVPLLYSSDKTTDALAWPNALTQFAIRDSALLAEFDSVRIATSLLTGIHLQFTDQNVVPDTVHGWHPWLVDSMRVMQHQLSWQDSLQSAGFLSGSGPYTAFYDFRMDTLNTRDTILKKYTSLVERGMSTLLVDTFAWPIPEEAEREDRMAAWLAEYLNFKGLILSKGMREGPYENPYLNALKAGSDMVIVPDSSASDVLELARAEFTGKKGWKEEAINRRVKKILLAKSWAGQVVPDSLDDQAIKKKHTDRWREALIRRMHESSMTILKDEHELLPLSRIGNDSSFQVVHVGLRKPHSFGKVMPYFCKYRERFIRAKQGQSISEVPTKRLRKMPFMLLHLYHVELNDSVHSKFLASLQKVDEKKKLVIINHGHPQNVKLFDSLSTVVQVWEEYKPMAGMATNLALGGVAAHGASPMNMDSTITYGQGIYQKHTTRLAYNCLPEEVGLSSDTLKRINYIANTVISRRATPGCQIFVARKGKVVWNKTYGHHTYDKTSLVKWDDLYDVASITKVAATTLLAMDLYEKGKYNLDDSLKRFLPDSLLFTSLSNVTFREILVHKTGLSSGQNIIKFIKYENDSVGRYDLYYCDYADENYCVPIAENLWMDTVYEDSIWLDLNQQWIDKSKPYKYSDANFNLMYFMLQTVNKHRRPFHYQLKRTFYDPLGLRTTCFLPSDTFSMARIVPTEDEKYWRRQLLRGHVHDPTAALMGGIAGNAGLFSSASDMGVIFQMLLQGGTYGGKRFFKQTTVDLFTKKQPGSHRGLGFNKPTGNGGIIAPEASLKSFGHTGFTGCCVWVDPDDELVYVFLSNRVHPNAQSKKLVQNGTRKRIHQAIYDAMMDKPVEVPVDTVPEIENPLDSLPTGRQEGEQADSFVPFQ